MLNLLIKTNQLVWGFPMLVLLLSTHIYFTFRLKFVQKKLFSGIKLSVTPEDATEDGISGFATLMTTLAATLGTGNIVGVSTAVAFGGPGAIFWCWLTGVLGMATTYAECFLGVTFRKERVVYHNKKPPTKSYVGGPMYMLEYGLHNKKMAYLYALFILLSCFGVGCFTQSNAITDTAHSVWKLSPYLVGFLAALVTGLVIVGGISAISTICMKLIPAMTLFYMLSCLIILIINYKFIGEGCLLIIQSAFSKHSLRGGVLGGGIQIAARYGIARGLFTNEAVPSSSIHH